jgi:hypothetical protein
MISSLHVALRTLANRWLIDSCTIRRGTSTRTSAGTSVTWSDLATSVPCSLSPEGIDANERDGVRGGITSETNWRVRLPAGQDVTLRDRIVIGSRTFEVSGVEARTFEVRRSVLCVEIT